MLYCNDPMAGTQKTENVLKQSFFSTFYSLRLMFINSKSTC